MNSYLRETIEASQGQVYSEKDALKLVDPILTRLKAAEPEERLAFLFAAFQKPEDGTLAFVLARKGMTAALLRSGIELNSLQAVRLVEMASVRQGWFPYKAILSALAPLHPTEALKSALRGLRGCIDEFHGRTSMTELHQRIDELVNGPKQATGVAAAGAWTEQVFADVQQWPQRTEWLELFDHARSLSQSTPPKKWQDAAKRCVDAVGRAPFVDASLRWLTLGPMPGEASQLQVPDQEADYQKGFVWTVGAVGDSTLAPALADFALACLRKIPMIGAVSHRVGNACVGALAAMPGLEAVSQLSRLANRVKYDVARRLIEKALTEAAARNNVTRDDLEAMSVPTFGLDRAGELVEQVGDCQARLAIHGGEVSLEWSREGKTLKSVPAGLKTSHTEAVKELDRSKKELGAILAAQRLRLERLLLSTGSTVFDKWREWYLDNPVVAATASRLIWGFDLGDGQTATGIADRGRIVDWAGNPIETNSATRVRLWHPIQSSVQTVMNWRCGLEDRGLQQPFKQAHREVYILTDAERATGTLSNRFAAHILKQHQFAALARERGWQFTLMGQWDSHNIPSLDLPLYGLRAEFSVNFPGEDGEGAEITAHAVYKLIGTEDVQFRQPGKGGRFALDRDPPLRLEDVPAVVFSEVMRDVDLFTGVTSIGHDPSWGLDTGNQHLDYWRESSFGALSQAASERKALLERLLPRFAPLKDRCVLDGHFLVVRGSLNEYRIHLGSANILMEPGSRYLCIVQGPGDASRSLHLPFEGDRVLSLILSKAMMLVRDEAIKDVTIVRQLAR